MPARLTWYTLLAGGSLLLAAQSAHTTALMLYAWEDDARRAQPGTGELRAAAPPLHGVAASSPQSLALFSKSSE